MIAKDPSYLSLQYFMYLVTVACHLTLGVMNRTIHNNVCMYINRVLSMIKVSVLGGGLVVFEELYNNG